MMTPDKILNGKDYSNYRNVRAVSILFILLGSILALAGVSMFGGGETRNGREETHPAMAALLAVVGLCGAVGGIATLQGNRKWAPLVKVMAWLYLFGFPIGTILSYTLLNGFSNYLKSVERLRRAEYQEEDWEEDEPDEY